MSLTFPETRFCWCAGTVCNISSLEKRKCQERRKSPDWSPRPISVEELVPPRLVPGYRGEVTDEEDREKSVLSISSTEGELAPAMHHRLDQEGEGGWGLETGSTALAGGLGVGK